MSSHEIEEYGTNPVQLSAQCGLVIEVTNQDKQIYFKIPIINASVAIYWIAGHFYYQKVTHDLLNSKIGGKMCKSLTKHGIFKD